MQFLEVKRPVAARRHVHAEDGHHGHHPIAPGHAQHHCGDHHYGHAPEIDLAPAPMPIAPFAREHGQRRHHQGQEAGGGMEELNGGGHDQLLAQHNKTMRARSSVTEIESEMTESFEIRWHVDTSAGEPTLFTARDRAAARIMNHESLKLP